MNKTNGPVIKYGKGGGGGMEKKLEILKKILGAPQKLYAFSRPPPPVPE